MTPYCRTISADAVHLRVLRTELRAWLIATGAAVNVSQFLLVIGEACANAVEHAYLDSAVGTVNVTVEPTEGGDLVVEVRDHGQWRPPATVWGDRQRGTGLMQRLTRDFDRCSSDAGTTVRFVVPSQGGPAGE